MNSGTNTLTLPLQYNLDTPDYTVSTASSMRLILQLTAAQDSDTQPNTTASSVAGDAPVDGRKRRAEQMNMRKSIYGKKHDRLGASKVRSSARRTFTRPGN